MKKMILLSIILFLMLISGITFANLNQSIETQRAKVPFQQSDTLVILWTSGDPDVALKMIFMYAGTSARVEWWSHVKLIIWGPSSKLTNENPEIQQGIAKMQEIGVIVDACKACADKYEVSDKLSSLGIDVKYMGKTLTEHLKTGKIVLTLTSRKK